MSLVLPERFLDLADDPSHPGPLFDLAVHGDAIALSDGTRAWSYRELDRLAAEFAGRHLTGGERLLVMIECRNDLDTIVAHLAALNHGHVSWLVPSDHAATASLAAAYRPDVTVAGSVIRRDESPQHDLHPDLAMLLGTSGSTGSPKLVRLSRDNLTSNADAIASYLGLTGRDRAITSLPLQYCYGLSLLHSHLVAGAAMVLTDLSVVDQCFWDLVDREQVTTLAAVPYTIDLLDRSGFPDRSHPSLRRLTQAGGRLAPADVRRFAKLGRARDFDFYVMYGQTEATARMAYLPPDRAEHSPEAVGVAIPGGSLRLSDTGEVIYSGANVMMGYAESRRDLARGHDLTELRTGDLGEFRDGMLHITGRTNRIAKVFGLRIDLSRVESQLSHPAHVIADRDRLTVIGTHHRLPEAAKEVAALCGLPASAVTHVRVDAIPLNGNSKPDLTRLAELTDSGAETDDAPPAGALIDQIGAHYRTVLGVSPTEVDSFVSLGGDSLSFVELATRLEPCLPGGLPAGWHRMSLAELAGAHSDHAHTTPQDTSIILRALAIILIIGSHVELFDLMGGAHLLLAVAGFNFARFTLSGDPRTLLRRGLASLATIAVPASLWIATVSVTTGTYDLRTAAYLNDWLGSPRWDDNWQFWFLDTLILSTLITLLALSWSPLARLERHHRFGFALAALAALAALRFVTIGIQSSSEQRYELHAVAMFFALGWAASRATSIWQRFLVAALSLALVVGFFGEPRREVLILVGIAALVWLPTVRLPRPLARIFAHIATFSLCIYLTHWVVYPPLEADHPVLALLASIAVGTAYGVLVRPLQRRVSQIIRGEGETAHRPSQPGS